MAADHGGESGSFGIEIQGLKIVKHVNEKPGKLCDSGFRQGLGPVLSIDVAANGCDWSDCLKRGKDLGAADIAGMDDVLTSAESIESLRTQQTVCVGDHAESGHGEIG